MNLVFIIVDVPHPARFHGVVPDFTGQRAKGGCLEKFLEGRVEGICKRADT